MAQLPLLCSPIPLQIQIRSGLMPLAPAMPLNRHCDKNDEALLCAYLQRMNLILKLSGHYSCTYAFGHHMTACLHLPRHLQLASQASPSFGHSLDILWLINLESERVISA